MGWNAVRVPPRAQYFRRSDGYLLLLYTSMMYLKSRVICDEFRCQQAGSPSDSEIVLGSRSGVEACSALLGTMPMPNASRATAAKPVQSTDEILASAASLVSHAN